MAFKFIGAGASGEFQTIFSRLIEDPETISLIDTPGVLSLKAVPFDGIDDRFEFANPIILEDFGNLGASASNIVVDAWIKPNVTASTFNTFFDASILRSSCATTSGFDGIYNCHVLSGGTTGFIDFRLDFDTTYSLTSMNHIDTSAWSHVMCIYNSGDQNMSIYINGAYDRDGDIGSASVTEESAVGVSSIGFGGILDELRFWICTGSASSIGQLASVTAIGKTPESLSLNDFIPSDDCLAGWWRLDNVSAVQLFSTVENSIGDWSAHGISATPKNFEGSDVISSETTIIQGLSASGDLKNLQGGGLDHGGLTVIDPQNGKLIYEMGSENLIKDEYNSWTVTGGGAAVSLEENNIFYGASAVKINTIIQDTGAYIDISNSALLYKDNTYTCSMRMRSVTGSVSSRVTFQLGSSAVTITAFTSSTQWHPFILRNIVVGDSLSGRVTVTQLHNAGTDEGFLMQVDGLQVIEGDHPASFISASRTRKASQTNWPVLD